MVTFVVAHGAWGAGYTWRKMHPLLAAAGHRLVTPTYTGLGERVHLASRAVDLDLHIRDVEAVLFHEDLRNVHLVGHSYGGMVATGVADRARERISALIYLDAFVPRDGLSLFDLIGPEARAAKQAETDREGEGWRMPPNPSPADTPAADLAFLTPRRHPQPIGTFSQPLRLQHGETTLPRAYIYCSRATPGDVFGQFARMARSDPRWRYEEIDATHNPHVTAPDELARLLCKLAGGTS